MFFQNRKPVVEVVLKPEFLIEFCNIIVNVDLLGAKLDFSVIDFCFHHLDSIAQVLDSSFETANELVVLQLLISNCSQLITQAEHLLFEGLSDVFGCVYADVHKLPLLD